LDAILITLQYKMAYKKIMMKGENFILTIAIDRYNDISFPNLNNAKFDADRLIKVLTSKYGFNTIQEPLYDKTANRASIIDALHNLSSSLTANDSIIIYFAGHGTINPKTTKGYWIPYDATNNSTSNFINNSTVIECIEAIDAMHILLISDSCFSGTFLSKSRAIRTEEAYVKLERTKSRWVLASGREEKVSDGEPGKGSPFANALINFLENNSQSQILFSELSSHVMKETGKAAYQQPIFGNLIGHAGGQIVFRLVTKHLLNGAVSGTDSWETKFKEFCDAKHSRPEWPYISKENPETKQLGIWCADQRTLKRTHKLRPDREQRLLYAGFVFDPTIEKFYKGFAKFLAFMHKEGGINYVPKHLREIYSEESSWLRAQQKWFAKTPCDPTNPKAYPMYRFEILKQNGIHLGVNIKEEAWQELQAKIINYYKTHEKFISLPSQTDRDERISELGNKLNDYMVKWKRGELNPDKVKFLEQYIDKDYGENKIKREFSKQIQEFLDFKKFHPNQIPKQTGKYSKIGQRIADWKAKYKHNRLPQWKVDVLIAHGIIKAKLIDKARQLLLVE
jgi:hypothetical protein